MDLHNSQGFRFGTSYESSRTERTRAPYRGNTGEALLRAEKFGDSKTTDHKVFQEGCESRDNHRYAVVVQDSVTHWIQSYPCKQRLHKWRKEVCHNSWGRHTNHKSFTLTLNWNLKNKVHGIAAPETNDLAERTVRRVKESTSAVLLLSGLDERWWSDFMQCYYYLRDEQVLLTDEKPQKWTKIWVILPGHALFANGDKWWSDSMKYYCYLRHVQDLLADWETSYERRFGKPRKVAIISCWSNEWVSSDFSERAGRYSDSKFGRFWESWLRQIYSSRINAKEVWYDKKRWIHCPSRRCYKMVWKRRRIPRTHFKTKIDREEWRSQWWNSRRIGILKQKNQQMTRKSVSTSSQSKTSSCFVIIINVEFNSTCRRKKETFPI